MQSPLLRSKLAGLLIKVKSKCLSHTSWLSWLLPFGLPLTEPCAALLENTVGNTFDTVNIDSNDLKASHQIWGFVWNAITYALGCEFSSCYEFYVPHGLFSFFLKQQRFSQMQVCVLGERVRWELTDPRLIKSCGARNVIVTFLTGKGSRNFQFLFLKETPYGFVIDFQFFFVCVKYCKSGNKIMDSFSCMKINLGSNSPETTIEFSCFSWKIILLFLNNMPMLQISDLLC